MLDQKDVNFGFDAQKGDYEITAEVVRALVELTRTEESYDKGFRYARWEYWTFEPTQQSWDIRKRLYLHRERLTDEKALPAFEYRAEDRLKGVSENAKIE